MPILQNGVLGCACATTLFLVALAYIILLRDPQRTLDVPQLLFFLLGIAISALLLSGLRRREASPPKPGSAGTGITEVHDWGGDRVVITVTRSSHRGWVARVRFGDNHLVWQERGATSHEAHRKALEFFQQACPDHQCGEGCGRLLAGGPETDSLPQPK